MRMTKKITSIVLAVMMVVSMMSVMAFSANAAVGDYVAEKDYLTFTALEDDSSVMFEAAVISNIIRMAPVGKIITQTITIGLSSIKANMFVSADQTLFLIPVEDALV